MANSRNKAENSGTSCSDGKYKSKKKKAKQNIKAKQSQDGAISKEQMNK